MTAVQILDLKGNKVRELNLSDEVFAVQPSVGTVHTALVRQLANARSGSANTKTRAEVRGGGAKPWRQKGTGRARAGSKRSPLWEGGGVIFGPKPRDYSFAMPRKMRLVAIKSALTAKRDNLIVVKDFDELKQSKTKEAVQVLKNLEIANREVLIVLDFASENSSRFALAARNLPNVKVIHVNNLNVKDLLHAKSVLTTESAIEVMTNWLKPSSKTDKVKTSDSKKAEHPKAKATEAKLESDKAKSTAKASTVNNQTDESAVHGLEVKGSGAKGSGAKGSEAKGSESKGPVTRGSETKASETKASAAKGSEVKGSETKASAAEGSEVKGSETKVSEAKDVASKASSSSKKESAPAAGKAGGAKSTEAVPPAAKAKTTKAIAESEDKPEKKTKPKEEPESKPKRKSS